VKVSLLTRAGGAAQQFLIELKMCQLPLAVYFWPEETCSIPVEESLLVIAVRTPPTNLRAEARQLVRLALRQVLADKLSFPLADIEFISEPGQSLKLLQPRQKIGLSISHESGLSLAAINMNGKVGVDLVATNSSLTKSEMYTLSADYLGYSAAEYLSSLPKDQQNHAFAIAWTELEARLKCQEENLIEWSSSREKRLDNYSTRTLLVPEGYVATVAYLEH
jgi:4'-phosphopantetheinyl transferase